MASEAFAAALAAAYAYDEVPRCELIERVSNDVVCVRTSRITRWLKLANKMLRERDELEAEAEVVAALVTTGLAVAAPVRRADGWFSGEIALQGGPCLAVLFDDAPGVEVEAATDLQAELLGALVARLQRTPLRAQVQRRWTIDRHTLSSAPLAWLGQVACDVAAIRALAEIAAEMAEQVWPRDGAPLPTGLCHGDLHLENVRFEGDAPTLFDFEVCGLGPCIYDLACYWRKRVGLAPLGEPPPIAEWEALLRGYTRVRPLTAAELRAVPALATLRAIWTMALPASPHAQWGRDWLADPEYVAAHLGMIARLAEAARSAQ